MRRVSLKGVFLFATALTLALNSLVINLTMASPVELGSERLLEPQFYSKLVGKKIGVLSHHASRLHDGSHLVDFLFNQKDFKLTSLFAPEHGFRSTDDDLVKDSVDSVTGLPIFSLYGKRLAPTQDQLKQIDVMVIDLQDVGVRYYTYPATVALTLQACKNAGVPVLLLDRPNPLGGAIIEGAVLEKALLKGNIAAFAPISTRHAMTLGELALLFNEMLGIHSDLTVVPLKGWSRSMLWNETDLPWVPSSPALVTDEQVILYGIFGSMEAMNIAVGRGVANDHAFKFYGAPWITHAQATKLVHQLQKLQLPGLKFSYIQWTPTRREYLGKLCRGFEIKVTDYKSLDGFRSMILVMQTMKSALGKGLLTQGTLSALGTQWLLDGINIQTSAQTLIDQAQNEAVPFLTLRQKALLY